MTRKSTLALFHKPAAHDKPRAKAVIAYDRNTAGEALSLVLWRATDEKINTDGNGWQMPSRVHLVLQVLK